MIEDQYVAPTSVNNYQPAPRNIPEDRRTQASNFYSSYELEMHQSDVRFAGL
jgi:hypothetical protein